MKRWIITALIAAGVIGGGYGMSQIQDKPADVPKATAGETTTQQSSNANAEANNPPTISLEEYNKITPGMTYDQVVKIIGGPGTLTTEPGMPKGQTMYLWQGDGGNGKANINFRNGKVFNSGRMGLK